MAEDKKQQIDQETESANLEINEKFYGQQEENDNQDKNALTETEEANLELNDQLDSNDQDSGYSPPAYTNLNTAAIDVTKKD